MSLNVKGVGNPLPLPPGRWYSLSLLSPLSPLCGGEPGAAPLAYLRRAASISLDCRLPWLPLESTSFALCTWHLALALIGLRSPKGSPAARCLPASGRPWSPSEIHCTGAKAARLPPVRRKTQPAHPAIRHPPSALPCSRDLARLPTPPSLASGRGSTQWHNMIPSLRPERLISGD
jgi:hypothetical protein